MEKIWKIYKKHEEIINYLITGGLTTVISILTFALFNDFFNIHYISANIISWICAVTFAYITNKIFVFKSKKSDAKANAIESLKFLASRILTLLIDLGLMILLVETFKIDEFTTKLIVQIILIISNYILSKIFVFK